MIEWETEKGVRKAPILPSFTWVHGWVSLTKVSRFLLSASPQSDLRLVHLFGLQTGLLTRCALVWGRILHGFV
jgi:hypothetical protein